jgi:predicted permease
MKSFKGSIMSSYRLFEETLSDACFALRQLRKAPGFTITAVLTLALGIGAATTMYVVVYSVLLKSLPFPDAQRLYQPMAVDARGMENGSAPYSAIERWRDATKGSAEIALTTSPVSVLDTPSGAQLINNVLSSVNLLSTLGVQPILGRGFSLEEAEAGKSHVVLLSYSIWQEGFSADRDILGRRVFIDGVPFVVIGVMPPRFQFPIYKDRAAVWTPLENARLLAASASNFYDRFSPVLRLRDGVDPVTVQATLSSVQSQVARDAGPGEQPETHIRLAPLRDSLVSDIRPALTALEIAVALVWFIVCSNVAGLLLARIAARRTEIAIRGALGAGWPRILRQFLTESLVLSLGGALVGLALAGLVLRAAQHIIQRSLPLSVSFSLSWPILAALLGFSLLTALAFGVFPAVLATHFGFAEGLKYGRHSGASSRTQSRLRNLLLVSEVAVSLALLIAAGLMLRTLRSLEHVPLGFRTDHIVLTDLTIPGYMYKDSNVATTAWQPILERVQHLPGVRAAALSTVLPIGHSMEWLTLVYATGWTKGNVGAEVRAASPDLLQVLGVRLVQGRFVTAQDVEGSLPVAVVNQTFVKQYLGGRDAVGKRIRFGRIPSEATIAGVLEDIRQDAVNKPSKAELYLSMAQLKPGDALYLPLTGHSMQLAVRTETSPGAIIPALSQAIREENPHLVLGNLTTMDQSVEDSMGTQRLAAGLIGTFGALALVITVVGLYGLLSYSVTQRTREIGVRMALGADRGQVVGMVLWQAVVLMFGGIAIGLALTLWTNRLLQSFLYGVSRHDPWILALGPVVLLFSGTIAALLPARRAATVDPIQALRME